MKSTATQSDGSGMDSSGAISLEAILKYLKDAPREEQASVIRAIASTLEGGNIEIEPS